MEQISTSGTHKSDYVLRILHFSATRFLVNLHFAIVGS